MFKKGFKNQIVEKKTPLYILGKITRYILIGVLFVIIACSFIFGFRSCLFAIAGCNDKTTALAESGFESTDRYYTTAIVNPLTANGNVYSLKISIVNNSTATVPDYTLIPVTITARQVFDGAWSNSNSSHQLKLSDFESNSSIPIGIPIYDTDGSFVHVYTTNLYLKISGTFDVDDFAFQQLDYNDNVYRLKYSNDVFLYVSTVDVPVSFMDNLLLYQSATVYNLTEQNVNQIALQNEFNRGFNAGQVGKDIAVNNAYIEGRNEGLAIAENGDLKTLILSVGDTITSTLYNLLNFNFLGYNVFALFTSIITIILCVIVIKNFI